MAREVQFGVHKDGRMKRIARSLALAVLGSKYLDALEAGERYRAYLIGRARSRLRSLLWA
jgi:hypothetical protein